MKIEYWLIVFDLFVIGLNLVIYYIHRKKKSVCNNESMITLLSKLG